MPYTAACYSGFLTGSIRWTVYREIIRFSVEVEVEVEVEGVYRS